MTRERATELALRAGWKIEGIIDLMLAAVAEEREDCARIADAPGCVEHSWQGLSPMQFSIRTSESIAAQIRARGKDL